MDILCLGARANTKAQSKIYQKRSLIILMSSQTTLWLDCAADWQDEISGIPQQPDAIWISHSHEDHVGGLCKGAPAPVYASQKTWQQIHHFPIEEEKRHTLSLYESVTIGDITITQYNVHHSHNAPAYGCKIVHDACTIFYSSDVADIPQPHKALSNVDLYIGDGSIVSRTTLLKEQNGVMLGYAPITHQAAWCAEHQTTDALFVHCGAEIIKAGYQSASYRLHEIGKKYGVRLTLAHDCFETSCSTMLS